MSSTSLDDISPNTSLSDASVDDNGQSVGLSNPQLSQGRRRMLDLINRLHNTGVQVDIDLPMIAVIGSQSAGKSSLIESISGITLPRASGTCTRCPTECRLSRSPQEWKCIVSLHRTKDRKVVVEQFGDPILENAKGDVEDRIRRAQHAILNPGKAASHFLTARPDELAEPELNFSDDCVSLQISGPDVADLSFCDLPGLIAGVGRDGNKNDITFIEALASKYIKKPSCIILLTVACETDFQNQGAQELAKVFDPEGRRTIGVLTKPDRIPTGEEPSWLGFIRNEKEPLENNWYCVKQPGSNDLKQGMTWMDARRSEEQFFSFKSPWCDIDDIYKRYLGTHNLVSQLSAILSDLILKRMPEIQDEIEKSILNTRVALNGLPKEPSKDPHNEIAALIYDFVADLSKRVEGVPDKDGIIQSIRPAHNEFKRSIRRTAPEFVPFERRDAKAKMFNKPSFLNDEEGDSIEVKDEEYPVCTEEHSLNNAPFEEECAPSPSLRHPPDLPQGVSNIIYLDEVLEKADEARTRELQGNYPFVVQENFVRDIIVQWHKPARRLCQVIYVMMNEHIKQLVTLHFSSFGQGGLEQRVRALMQEHLRKCMERSERHITWLLDIEERPFTLNTHYLQDYKHKFLSHYRDARGKDRNPQLTEAAYSQRFRGGVNESNTPLDRAIAALAEVGIHGIKPEDFARLITPDGMDHALNIMADVRAYFQVAYKRFVDNVPLTIDLDLVRGIHQGILKMLNTGLGISGPKGPAICKELAQEHPNIFIKREELMKKLERMTMAAQELTNLQF